MRILRLACSTAPHTQDMAGPREIRAGDEHATAIPVRGGMLVRSEFGREDDDHDGGGDGDNDYSYEDFRTEQYNHSETRTYDLYDEAHACWFRLPHKFRTTTEGCTLTTVHVAV